MLQLINESAATMLRQVCTVTIPHAELFSCIFFTTEDAAVVCSRSHVMRETVRVCSVGARIHACRLCIPCFRELFPFINKFRTRHFNISMIFSLSRDFSVDIYLQLLPIIYKMLIHIRTTRLQIRDNCNDTAMLFHS